MGQIKVSPNSKHGRKRGRFPEGGRVRGGCCRNMESDRIAPPKANSSLQTTKQRLVSFPSKARGTDAWKHAPRAVDRSGHHPRRLRVEGHPVHPLRVATGQRHGPGHLAELALPVPAHFEHLHLWVKQTKAHARRGHQFQGLGSPSPNTMQSEGALGWHKETRQPNMKNIPAKITCDYGTNRERDIGLHLACENEQTNQHALVFSTKTSLHLWHPGADGEEPVVGRCLHRVVCSLRRGSQQRRQQQQQQQDTHG